MTAEQHQNNVRIDNSHDDLDAHSDTWCKESNDVKRGLTKDSSPKPGSFLGVKDLRKT